jgi:hypothetical protein
VLTAPVLVVDGAVVVVVPEAASAQATARIKRANRGRFIGGPII